MAGILKIWRKKDVLIPVTDFFFFDFVLLEGGVKGGGLDLDFPVSTWFEFPGCASAAAAVAAAVVVVVVVVISADAGVPGGGGGGGGGGSGLKFLPFLVFRNWASFFDFLHIAEFCPTESEAFLFGEDTEDYCGGVGWKL